MFSDGTKLPSRNVMSGLALLSPPHPPIRAHFSLCPILALHVMFRLSYVSPRVVFRVVRPTITKKNNRSTSISITCKVDRCHPWLRVSYSSTTNVTKMFCICSLCSHLNVLTFFCCTCTEVDFVLVSGNQGQGN